MENLTVSQLTKDARFDGLLLVRSAERKLDKNNRAYVDINLGDRTGEINGKIWNWSDTQDTPEPGIAVEVHGIVQEYNGRLQFRIESIRAVRDTGAVDMSLLVPGAPRASSEMLAEMEEVVGSFRSAKLRALTEEMLRMAGDRLSYYPAAQRMHHAEYGGLLHHTTDMLHLAEGVLKVYPWLNRDLLLAGVILHDLGKLEEMASDRFGNVADYTRDGQLMGHLVRGVVNLNRAAEKTGVRGEMLALLEHMLLSHHGEAEYGSPKPPMFPEAEALHWIDMMDSRLNTMKGTEDKTPAGAFSEKVFSLDRRVYHPRYTDEAE